MGSRTKRWTLRHADNNIRTLLLPGTWRLDTLGPSAAPGYKKLASTFFIAFGFLEWSEPNQAETSYTSSCVRRSWISGEQNREPSSGFPVLVRSQRSMLFLAEKLKIVSLELSFQSCPDLRLRSISLRFHSCRKSVLGECGAR